MSIQITPLTGSIGGLVEGIDLKHPLSDEQFDMLHEAFLRYSVLVYRGQQLEPAHQMAFASRWGTPTIDNPLLMGKGIGGFPEVQAVTKIPKATASTEAWHYDGPYGKVPAKISILAAVTVPNGGDTMWCNQYLAYERLSPAMQRMIEGLRVKFVGLRLGRMLGVPASELPSAVHPLVRTHPETGRKALYVGHRETAQEIEGLTPAESRPLLDFLYEHSTQPDNLYRHMWQVGDVVMWDNRCTMHYAVHDYGDADRLLHRVTLKGEVPV